MIAAVALVGLFATDSFPLVSSSLASAETIEGEWVIPLEGAESPGSIIVDTNGKITDADFESDLQGMCIQRDTTVETTTRCCIGQPWCAYDYSEEAPRA